MQTRNHLGMEKTKLPRDTAAVWRDVHPAAFTDTPGVGEQANKASTVFLHPTCFLNKTPYLHSKP